MHKQGYDVALIFGTKLYSLHIIQYIENRSFTPDRVQGFWHDRTRSSNELENS